jgi:hypothetical protein
MQASAATTTPTDLNFAKLEGRVQEMLDGEILGPNESLLSTNLKTGYSLNFPVTLTCDPTAVCRKLCYGIRPGRPITFYKSLRKQIRLFNYFKQTPPEEIAERLHLEYVKKKLKFLRWNGVGELFPEAVEVINTLTARYPEMVLSVVSRVPAMTLLLNDAPNLFVMFSLDASPESRERYVEMALAGPHPRVYYSYLRWDADEDTMDARIVFNAQQRKSLLPYEDPKTVCPVDADKLDLKNACVKCRRCWTPVSLDGLQHGRRNGSKTRKTHREETRRAS